MIELATHKIEISGITPNPKEPWMMQIGRNLTDPVEGFLADKELLILDRDCTFFAKFCNLLSDDGVEIVRLPPRSPNLNAYASVSVECFGSIIELLYRSSYRTFVESN